MSEPHFARWLEEPLRDQLARPYVHLLFGARQTGKSTLLQQVIPDPALRLNFADPLERAPYLANPGRFLADCRALPDHGVPHFVLVDEAQAVPEIFDAVQTLYDADKGRWRFILCGSSARKLRQTGANLLPGRSFQHRLYPLTLMERPADSPRSRHAECPLPFPSPEESSPRPPRRFPPADLETRLAYGDLPGVVTAPEPDRAPLLRAYAQAHLEEEMRREAMVRDWGAFLRFLQFAAVESGQILNYAAISQETGISQPTVKAHYQLLEDMFVGFTVPAFSGSPRKNLLSTPRFYFFDLGVRHGAAGLNAGRDIVRANPGPLFEQWVGLELWRRLRYLNEGSLSYYRTRDGTEVDFIVERGGRLIPIEVKWTENPAPKDARSLVKFLADHSRTADAGYVICRCRRPTRLHERVVALPWFDL